jgi:micrococcal nuclease
MRKVVENRLFLAIILAAFIIGFFHFLSVYISGPSGLAGYAAEDAWEQKLVTRIIDGDTVVIEGGNHVRLLGIDADERGYPCYGPAKDRLEELVLNREVYLEPDLEDKDQYGRLLRYIILEGENNEDININLKLVEEGLAIARFYDNVKYREEITAAEKYAIDNNIGCKWSE